MSYGDHLRFSALLSFIRMPADLNDPRSELDIHGKEADQVGEQFAAFALGSLATMINTNPQIRIPGHLPHLGHSVTLYEPYFAILVAFIVGTHFVIFIATIYWARGAEENEAYGVGMQDLGAQPNDSQQHLSRDTQAYSVGTYVFDEHPTDAQQDHAHDTALEEQQLV